LNLRVRVTPEIGAAPHLWKREKNGHNSRKKRQMIENKTGSSSLASKNWKACKWYKSSGAWQAKHKDTDVKSIYTGLWIRPKRAIRRRPDSWSRRKLQSTARQSPRFPSTLPRRIKGYTALSSGQTQVQAHIMFPRYWAAPLSARNRDIPSWWLWPSHCRHRIAVHTSDTRWEHRRG
jgi:hypothetical protein